LVGGIFILGEKMIEPTLLLCSLEVEGKKNQKAPITRKTFLCFGTGKSWCVSVRFCRLEPNFTPL